MDANKRYKLKHFLQSMRQETVCLASWLEEIGISRNLQKRYRKSGWITSIGTGAFIKEGDSVGWQGGVFAMQEQGHLPIYPGGPIALSLQGFSHYIRMQKETLTLFAPPKTVLPCWFRQHEWKQPIDFIRSALLPPKVGFSFYEERLVTIQISSPERAILECLYMAPEKMDLVECYQIMEGLVNLRPKLVQELLLGCSSIKVKRLFLYMAEKAGHTWLNFIDKETIYLGNGDRSIVKGGGYISSYKITLPRELIDL